MQVGRPFRSNKALSEIEPFLLMYDMDKKGIGPATDLIVSKPGLIGLKQALCCQTAIWLTKQGPWRLYGLIL